MKFSDMKKAAEKAGAVKSLTPTYYEFEKKGDSIVGRYRGRAPVKSSMGEGVYYHYIFETDDGLLKCALGAATDKEAGSLMVVDGVYAVTFQGQTKISGGRSVNKFVIEGINERALAEAGTGEEAPF